jgi:hypothetical protein
MFESNNSIIRLAPRKTNRATKKIRICVRIDGQKIGARASRKRSE